MRKQPPVEYRRYFTCHTCTEAATKECEEKDERLPDNLPFAQMSLNELKIHMANVHQIFELKGRKSTAACLDFARSYCNSYEWVFKDVTVFDVESGPRGR